MGLRHREELGERNIGRTGVRATTAEHAVIQVGVDHLLIALDAGQAAQQLRVEKDGTSIETVTAANAGHDLLLLALVLGELAEISLRRGMRMADYDLSEFLFRPIGGTILAVTLITLLFTIYSKLKKKPEALAV